MNCQLKQAAPFPEKLWYAVRFEALQVWARKVDAKEVFNILANGTEDVYTPNTYQQQLEILKCAHQEALKRIKVLESTQLNGSDLPSSS